MPKTEMYRTKSGERRFQVAAPVAEETYEALRLIAYREGTTIAAQVRKAVTDYVVRRKKASRHVS